MFDIVHLLEPSGKWKSQCQNTSLERKWRFDMSKNGSVFCHLLRRMWKGIRLVCKIHVTANCFLWGSTVVADVQSNCLLRLGACKLKQNFIWWFVLDCLCNLTVFHSYKQRQYGYNRERWYTIQDILI